MRRLQGNRETPQRQLGYRRDFTMAPDGVGTISIHLFCSIS